MGEHETEIKALERSISAMKGHFTRQSNNTKVYMDAYEKTPSTFSRQQLETEALRLQSTADKIQDLYLELQTIDESTVKSATEKAAEHAKIYHKARDDIAFCLANVEIPTAPDTGPPAPAPVPARTGRSDPGLEPQKLGSSNNLPEFRRWVSRFTAHCRSNQYVTEPLAVQQEIFRKYLQDDMICRLDHLILEDTQVFPPDPATLADGVETPPCCLGILEEEFSRIYPLLSRRLDVFRTKQKEDQLFTKFLAEFKARVREADLDTIRPEDLQAFLVLILTTDKELQERFFKLEDLSLESMENEALRYEAQKRQMGAVSGKSTVNQVKGKGKGKKKGKNRGRSKSKGRSDNNGRSKSRPRDGSKDGESEDEDKGKQESQRRWKRIKGRCYHCGSKNHNSADCEVKDNLTCNDCGKPGHKSSVCLHGHRKSGNKSKANSRATSPDGDRSNMVTCASVGGASKPTPRVTLTLKARGCDSFDFPSCPDTGATRSIIAHDLCRRRGVKWSRSTRESLFAANGTRMRVSGSVKLYAQFQGQPATIDALVTPDISNDILVSWHDLAALGVIPADFPHTKVNAVASDDSIDSILQDYTDVLIDPAQVNAVASLDEDSIALIMKDYADVLKDNLGTQRMSGDPMKIYLRDDKEVVPVKWLTPRRTPVHLQESADKVIKLALENKIIERVTWATDWVSPAQFVAKPDGSARLITDYTRLNDYVRRPIHPFASAREIVDAIQPASKWFAKLDAASGYHQVSLHEDYRDLTTFILPSGTYRYLVAPMGLNSSGDEFCIRSDLAIRGLDYVHKIVDDALIEAETCQDLFTRIREVLDRFRAHGITCSKKKFVMGQSISFAGYLITDSGIRPDPARTESIRDFPVPQNVSDIRSFLGLAQQLAHFIPDLAQASYHIRGLLQKDAAFIWLPDHQAEFEKLKEMLTSDLLVHPFDKDLQTEVLTDAAKTLGLGYALIQRTPEGNIRLVSCGSRGEELRRH